MSRPGFVLEIDERTPPLLVPDGDRFRLEKFPLGTRVIYPVESLPHVPDLAEAINVALDAPTGSEPLSALLEPSMRLTIAFEGIGLLVIVFTASGLNRAFPPVPLPDSCLALIPFPVRPASPATAAKADGRQGSSGH